MNPLASVCRECGADGELGRSIVHRPGCGFYRPPPAHQPESARPFDVPVVPSCPEACCWRTTCATTTQEGIRGLWEEGRISRPEECVFFSRRARIHRQTTGHEPPATVELLMAQLATVRQRPESA